MTDFDNLAKLIKEAAKVREESYVKSRRKIEGISTGHYKLTISEACEKVAKEMGLGQQYSILANIILFTSWNDALDWADTQIYPVEMAYIEGCYRVANNLHWDPEDKTLGLSESQKDELQEGFAESAKSVRNSLYGFGE